MEPLSTTRVTADQSRFRVERDSALPPLSWLLWITGASSTLICGRSVATGPISFFEGAWAAPFAAWQFGCCPDIFGSGGQITSDGWLIVPPSHALECIYLLHGGQEGEYMVSNSLAFLMARSGARFTVPSWRLSTSFIGIAEGLDHTPAVLDTTAGTLWLVYHHNIVLSSDGPSIRPKPLPDPFQTYAEYSEYLRSVLGEIAANAAASERPTSYELLATTSTGYDSPACASLARSAGCTAAVTFATGQHGRPDDGSEIARQLGLSVAKIRRPDGAGEFDQDIAALFFAPGMHGEEVVFASLADVLPHRVLVTGLFGDKVWSLHSTPNDKLIHGDVNGASLGEFRLAMDFVHVPLPFAGARRHKDIHRISHTEEMRPYSVCGSYNRPIPRRIAEEAGVSRSSFGQSKKAIALLAFRKRALVGRSVQSAALATVRSLGFRQRFEYVRLAVWYRIGMIVHSVLWMGERLIPRALRGRYGSIRRAVQRLVLRKPYSLFEHSDPFMGIVFDWAVHRVMTRSYKTVREDPG